MSFSSNVKRELAHHFGEARHCDLAELAAIINICGEISKKEENFCVKVQTENVIVARKYFTLLKKAFNIESKIEIKRNNHLKKNRVYILHFDDDGQKGKNLLLATGILKNNNGEQVINNQISTMVVASSCCKRAYLRGSFISSGSISDPEKTYHMEFITRFKEYGEDLKNLVNSFGMDSKIIQRKDNFIIYLKEGEQIVDLLNIMGAPVALMEMENVRIMKDMRNNVNRKVNCEMANLGKTISAAVKQTEDIVFIKENFGLDVLPNPLKELALARTSFPEASLKELGEMMEPNVGKSGVNHRFRKIGEIAEKLREEMVENYG